MSRNEQDQIPFHRRAFGDREAAAAVEVVQSNGLTIGAKATHFERTISLPIWQGMTESRRPVEV